MNYFSIKDIENLTGIKAHTLRIWEQRYNICIPKRKESNHRYYESDTLKDILKISYLYHKNIKISKIAAFNNQELNNTAEHYLQADDSNEKFITRLVEASIDFNEVKFEAVFTEAINRHGIEYTLTDIIYPYLEKIGLLWLTDHVIPAQEHFVSNLINRKIIVAIDHLPLKGTKDKNVLLFAPEKEHHEIPLLLLQFLYKKEGYGVIYFGPNMSVEKIQTYTTEKHIDYLHFHVITNLTNLSANEYVEILSKKFTGQKIVVSGPIAREVTNQFSNVIVLKTRSEVQAFISKN